MTNRNKAKLAALNKENCEEHPRSILASNSNVPRSQEDYITQVSEEIEGRVTKKLSQEFSRTENRILGALARLDDFLMKPLQGHSWTTLEASRNVFSINQGTNEDDSQSNPHPEAGLLTSVREDRHDMVTAVQRESVEGHDTRRIRNVACIKFRVVEEQLPQTRQRHHQTERCYAGNTVQCMLAWEIPPMFATTALKLLGPDDPKLLNYNAKFKSRK